MDGVINTQIPFDFHYSQNQYKLLVYSVYEISQKIL